MRRASIVLLAILLPALASMQPGYPTDVITIIVPF